MIPQESLTQKLLWQELEDAADLPEEADLVALCQILDQAISLVPENLQLRVGGEAIVQLAGVYASRANALLDAWERSQTSLGPVLTAQGLADLLVRQSMRVDLSDLIEVPEHKYVRSENPPRFDVEEDSIVVTVDKDVLLKALEESDSDDAAVKAKALAVAHPEDISVWVKAISHYFHNRQEETLPLIELVQKVQYPLGKGEQKGSSLIKTWLALLLGGFQLEQQVEDFYDLRGISVRVP